MVTISGEVDGWSGYAVDSFGGSNVITVASTGQLVGAGGVHFNGVGTGANQVLNNGSMLATTNDAVFSQQAGTFVVNTGTILAAIGGGALNDAVHFAGPGTAGTKNTLVNSGVIVTGSHFAVEGDNGVDEIINTGGIAGSVS